MSGQDPSSLELPGGTYRLVRRLGRGQFGVVYRAEAPGGVPVAVKVIERTLKDEEAKRELQALQVVKELRHPFLLSLQAFYPLEDRLVIVLELADRSLRARLEECGAEGKRAIPPQELLGYFREAAEALDFLHFHKVQHRDIKPDNLLLLGRHLKVADCGLARMIEEHSLQSASSVGTPAYMAPEVWNRGVHRHSDQYSLAVTYAELRCGAFPFARPNLAKLIHAHLNEEPELGVLGLEEQAVLRQALAKDASRRFESCSAWVEALADALRKEAPVLIGPAPSRSPAGTDVLQDKVPATGSDLDRGRKTNPAMDTATSRDAHTATASDQQPRPAQQTPALSPEGRGVPGRPTPVGSLSLLLGSLAIVCVLTAALLWAGWQVLFPGRENPIEEKPPVVALTKPPVDPLPPPKPADPQQKTKDEPKKKEEPKTKEEPKQTVTPVADPTPRLIETLEKQILAFLPLPAAATERLKEPVEPRAQELKALQQNSVFSKISQKLQDMVNQAIEEFDAYATYKQAFPKSAPDPAAVKTQQDLERIEKVLEKLKPPPQYASLWSQLPLVLQYHAGDKDIQALRQAVLVEEKTFRPLIDEGHALLERGKKLPVDRSKRDQWSREVNDFLRSEPRPIPKLSPLPGAAGLTYQTVLAFDSVASLHNEWSKTKADLASLQRALGSTPVEPEPVIAVGEIRRFLGHTSGIAGLAWTKDRKRAYSAAWDRSIRIWDVDTGKELQQYLGHTDSINSLALSADETRLLSASNDNTMRMWDTKSGKEIKQYLGHTSTLTCVLFVPGNKALSSSLDKTIRLWDLDTAQELARWEGHTSEVNNLSLSPKGGVFLSVSSDGTVRKWDLNSSKELARWTFGSPLYWASYSPDGSQALIGGQEHKVRLIDANTGEVVRLLEGHTDTIWSVAFSPDGSRALSASADQSLRLWDVATGKTLHVFQGHKSMALRGMFSHDGRMALSADSTQAVILWGLPR